MTINLKNTLVNTLLLLIILYFLQGALYSSGSVIAKMSLLLILIISAYYTIKSINNKIPNSTFGILLFTFIALHVLGYFIVVVSGNELKSIHEAQLKNIITVCIAFFPFYFLSYKGYITIKKMKVLTIAFLIVSIFQFNLSQQLRVDRITWTDGDVVVNLGYYFVMLIPYAFLWKKNKTIPFILLLCITYFVIESAKRGALVCFLGGLVVYICYQIRSLDKEKLLQNTFNSFLFAALITSLLYKLISSNEFLINRFTKLSEGDSSGRSYIYNSLVHNWINTDSFFNFVFGFGFVSTIKYSGTGNLAHNDWLEIITNFGLLGLFLYLCLFITILYNILFKNFEYSDKWALVCVIIIWLLQSNFSMFYNAYYSLILTALIGFILGHNAYHIRNASNVLSAKVI